MNAEQIKIAYAKFEGSKDGAQLTNRLIETDPNFECPEWAEQGEIEGVPCKVMYRTEIPKMEEGDEYDWVDMVNWEESISEITIDDCECDRQETEQSKIDAVKAKYGI